MHSAGRFTNSPTLLTSHLGDAADGEQALRFAFCVFAIVRLRCVDAAEGSPQLLLCLVRRSRVMAFTEGTKLEAKRRAHFSCVVCHQLLVEIHHIVPQVNGGSDEIDNAAALCAYCHDLLGGNPDKRKQIRQMRDFWYELCETRFRDSSSLVLAKDLEELKSSQEEQGAMISGIKNLLEKHYSHQSDEIAAASTASEVASLSGVAIPQPKRTRWLKSPWQLDELRGKRVFAHFVTASGHGYEGSGEIRVRQNPDGLVAIDLVFTRRDTAYQFTDILFHISSRQLPHLKEASSGAGFDFEYEGTLTPDVEPDDTSNV